MGLISSPSTPHCPIARTISKSNPVRFISIELSHHKTPGRPVRVLGESQQSIMIQPTVQASFPFRHRNGTNLLPVAATNSKQPGGDEEEQRALEAVLKFYSAIKNQNTKEVSDVIGDECRFFCNFISSLQPFQGKQQVLEFITHLIKTLGNSIEFVITPTMDDGLSVAVKWRLECNKTGVPLGKGISYHLCNVYHGKLVISNVEMIMEPFLHMEPLRLKLYRFLTSWALQRLTLSLTTGMKLVAFAMSVNNTMRYYREVFQDKKRRVRVVYILLLCLLLLTAITLT